MKYIVVAVAVLSTLSFSPPARAHNSLQYQLLVAVAEITHREPIDVNPEAVLDKKLIPEILDKVGRSDRLRDVKENCSRETTIECIADHIL